MRKTTLHLALAGVLLLPGALPAGAQERDLFDLTTSPQSYKDPVDAFKLAFFPGAFIHGRGHLFAQDRTLATALLTTEVISVVAMGLGFWMNNKPDDFEDYPGSNGSGSQAQRNGKSLITYGAGLFVLGWIVDMAHAPLAADNHNVRYGLKPIVRGEPGGGQEILLVLNRNF